MNEDTYHLGIKALITNGEGEILLLKVNSAELHTNKHGEYWDLPGGRVQEGSTAQDTLQREVEEELGISNVKSGKPMGMVLSNIRTPLAGGGSVGLILSVYECILPEGSNIELSFEHTVFQWFSPRQAAELLAIKYPQDFCELVAAL